MTTTNDELLVRVGATTPTHDLANSLYKCIFDDNQMPVVRAIGAGAVGQACKGIAVASTLVASRGRTLATTIGFDTVRGETGDEISAQTFYLFLR